MPTIMSRINFVRNLVKHEKRFCNLGARFNETQWFLLNLLNELSKSDKMRGLPAFYVFFATSLISSLIQEHDC